MNESENRKVYRIEIEDPLSGLPFSTVNTMNCLTGILPDCFPLIDRDLLRIMWKWTEVYVEAEYSG